MYQPTSTFSLDDIVCQYQSTDVYFTGIASDSASFYWDFNSAIIISGSEAGPYSIYWDGLGTKNVSLSIDDNGCSSAIKIDSIEHNPIPTLTINSPDKICFNSFAEIIYTGTASDLANYQWNFDDGSIISGSGAGPYEIQWNTHGIKTITLYVTENGCSADTTNNLTVNEQTQTIPICMVGVDSLNYNIIVWEQSMDNPYDSIIIYKETSQLDIYDKIGSQSASNPSLFIDTLSNPAQNSNRYKISVLDTCGYETPQSDYHKTMHLTISSAIGGSWNLIWDSYEGFEYSTFNIYRSISENTFTKIAELASNLFTYTDISPPLGTLYYLIEVENSDTCNPGNKNLKNYYSSSRSNIVSSVETIVNYLTESDFQIVPNPSEGSFNFSIDGLKDKILIIVYSNSGSEIIKKEYESINNKVSGIIDLTNYPEGIYIIKILEKSVFETRKIILLK